MASFLGAHGIQQRPHLHFTQRLVEPRNITVIFEQQDPSILVAGFCKFKLWWQLQTCGT